MELVAITWAQALRRLGDDTVYLDTNGDQQIFRGLSQVDAFRPAIVRVGPPLHQLQLLQLVEIGANGHGLQPDTGGNIGLLAAIDGGNRQKRPRLARRQAKPGVGNAPLERAVEKSCAAIEQECQRFCLR